MRIGIDARFLEDEKGTGVANYMKNLILHLAEIDQENEYFLYYNSLKRTDDQFPIVPGRNFINKVIRFPVFQSRLFNKIWARLLEKAMRKDNIDVAHFMCSAFPPKTFLKTVSTIHDLTSYCFPEIESKHKRDARFFEYMMERTVAGVDQIISVSQMTKDDIGKVFPHAKDKVNVVYPGIEEKKVNFSEKEITEFKEQFGLGDRNILFVGSFEKKKNIETLIKAFHRLKNNQDHDVKLVLIGGKGSASKSIDALIKQLDVNIDIIRPGYVFANDLLKFYKAAEVLVFPSFYEGFGIPCLEAMARGVPLVTSNIPIFKEIVGDRGIYFQPDSVDDLVKKILSVLNNNDFSEDMINYGYECVKMFTWQKTARQTLEIYNQVYQNL